jgi:pimeloyl-ACP methyl ester carboxylesterase
LEIMPILSVNGVKLNYLRTGKGADVVLAHGLASSSAFWYPGIVLPLRHCYRVTAYDLRGHGYSSMPPSGYTHIDMAGDLAAMVDRLGLPRFHLIGHSFGGLLAISYALRHPGRLRSLVLADVPLNEIGTAPFWPSWWPSLLRLQELGIVIPWDEPYPELKLLEELARPNVRQRVGKLLSEPVRLPYGWSKGTERTAKRWLKLLDETSARDDIRHRQVSATDLGRIGVRTLAVYGTESKWRSSAEILRECLPEVEVVYVDKAGHAHPWERPDVFFRHVHRFLAASECLDADLSFSRRQFERFPLEMAVALRTAGGMHYPARTVDVSRTGLRLGCSGRLGRGSAVEVVAPVDEGGSSLIIPGEIVRTARDEAGEGFRLGVSLLWGGEVSRVWEELLAGH